jgi:hypothetical protein
MANEKMTVRILADCVFDESVYFAGEVSVDKAIAARLLDAKLAAPVDAKVERAVRVTESK